VRGKVISSDGEVPWLPPLQIPPCWGVKAGMVRVWVAGKTCDHIVTHGPYLSVLLRDKGLIINKALYKFICLL